MPRLLSVLCALVLLPLELARARQGTCSPSKDSHEARLFAAFAVPLAYRTAEQPATLASGRLRSASKGPICRTSIRRSRPRRTADPARGRRTPTNSPRFRDRELLSGSPVDSSSGPGFPRSPSTRSR